MSTSQPQTAYSLKPSDEKLVARAIRCLEKRLRFNSETLSSSRDVISFTRLHLADEKHEVFAVVFLNSQNCLIAFEKLFNGSISEAPVFPRVVVQKALEYNAAKVILAHCHPSGNPEPSDADKELTRELQKILLVVCVKVLDHIIIAREKSYSFADHSLI